MDTVGEVKGGVRLSRAMLIDDDNVVHFMSRLIIEQLHLVDECIFHYNGATALQMLKNEYKLGHPPPDLILLDLNMPIMGGFEFLEYLNERIELSFLLKRTLVLTSTDSPNDVDKVRNLGAR